MGDGDESISMQGSGRQLLFKPLELPLVERAHYLGRKPLI